MTVHTGPRRAQNSRSALSSPQRGRQDPQAFEPPHLAAQRQLIATADASAPVQGLQRLQAAADAHGARTLQRKVQKSTAPWGPTKGKWITTLKNNVGYDTQEEAQQAEDRIVAQQQQAAEAAWQVEARKKSWSFANGEGRLSEHYTDGWGALYGIQSHVALREYIEAHIPGDEAVGRNRIDLGTRVHPTEGPGSTPKRRPCYIMYELFEAEDFTHGGITHNINPREAFHCGPGNG